MWDGRFRSFLGHPQTVSSGGHNDDDDERVGTTRREIRLDEWVPTEQEEGFSYETDSGRILIQTGTRR